MKDTPQHIIDLQLKLILAKPEAERIKMGLEMIDFTRNVFWENLKRDNPKLTNGELHGEFFRRAYNQDFSPEKLEIIAQSIIAYHDKKIKFQ